MHSSMVRIWAQRAGGALLVGLFVVPNLGPARAALITGSEGMVTINGNDALNPTGSFDVEVAYAVFDGTSASDPLGNTGSFQISFVLNHLGDDGEGPALAMGRFTVFAPDVFEPIAFYSGASVVDPAFAGEFLIGPSGSELDPFGGIAPSFTDVDPPTGLINRAEFFFQTGLGQADLNPGEHSQLLIATTDSDTLPGLITIELDLTDTVPGVHGDTTINIVPEPGLGLFMITGAWALGRRRRGANG